MNKVLAVILAGGSGERLSVLCDRRSKPSLPFGGSYRIIDFTLSNCANSSIDRVAVLTQYEPRSLHEHIGTGRPWHLEQRRGGVALLPARVSRHNSGWYLGTADAIYQNLHYIEEERLEYVIILAGDHIYKMQYEEMIASHIFRQADVTVGAVEVPWSETERFGIMTLDDEGHISSFVEKPTQATSNLASMGIYIFKTDVMMARLREDAMRKTSHDLGRDIVPMMVDKGDAVYGFRFNGYWRDVGTLESYWAANMDLVVDLPELNLYDEEAPVFTRQEPRPPAKTGPISSVSRSLVSAGCIINGTVRSSVLGPDVYIEAGAIVAESIIGEDVFISAGARLHRVIVDDGAWIGADAHIGVGDDYTPNRDEPQHLTTGLTVIGRRARVPATVVVGRNCKVNAGVKEDDWPRQHIGSGETVTPSRPTEPMQVDFESRERATSRPRGSTRRAS